MSLGLVGELGSFNHFVSDRALDPASPDSLGEYTAALGGLRDIIARLRGISLSELHTVSPATPVEEAIAWDGETARDYARALEGIHDR